MASEKKQTPVLKPLWYGPGWHFPIVIRIFCKFHMTMEPMNLNWSESAQCTAVHRQFVVTVISGMQILNRKRYPFRSHKLCMWPPSPWQYPKNTRKCTRPTWPIPCTSAICTGYCRECLQMIVHVDSCENTCRTRAKMPQLMQEQSSFFGLCFQCCQKLKLSQFSTDNTQSTDLILNNLMLK